MNTRFYNGYVLSMKKNMEVTFGEVWVEGPTISYVGPSKECSIVWDREIDLNHNLIMPGFKNAHTHSAMTCLRSMADDKPLKTWLEESIFPMEAKLTKDDIYHLSKLAILEYLTSGITANFDMYFYPESIAQASYDCGMRTVILGGLNDFVQSPSEIEENYLNLNKNNRYNGLITYEMGFHAEYTTSHSILQELSIIAKKHKAPVYTHISETKQEVEECIKRHSMTPAVYLNSLGLFDYGGGGFHGVYLTKEDIHVFKEKKLSLVLNCSANLKLASGIAPINDFIAAGLNIGVGTDGPASNNSLDMFKEMFLVSGLGKVQSDPSSVCGSEVLAMATRGSAKAMNLENCDSLSKGKLADLIVIDMHKPNMQPVNHIVNNIVYSGSKDNIKLTMINGEILYENGEFSRFSTEEVEEIYRKSNQIVNRIRNT
ncbi:amidohydrolase [Niallia sp. 03133]|uniref:amidohydrolase n=1 Tax=Niallia sp. 03133 TaxID=3458060 RepID=UPI0040440ED6